jgi:integrase
MSQRNSTRRVKPSKPHPEFPLFPHATGRWAKKIRGKFVYFGKWEDGPDAALARYNEQKHALHAGLTPTDINDAFTVFRMCGLYLTQKKSRVKSGELSPRTYLDLERTCKGIQRSFGRKRSVADLKPSDFARLRVALAERLGPVRLGNEITRVRGVFKWARENRYLPHEMEFGTDFARPKPKVLRKHRYSRGVKMFTADEIRDMLDAADQPVKTMILLGVNCGFGNSDVGNLPIAALDLDGGWVNYPRPKTFINRRVPLWPETIISIQEWLTMRPVPKDPANEGLLFLTTFGASWHKSTHDDPLSKKMRLLLNELRIGGLRSFYTLRHVFQTIGGATKDRDAVAHIMGHADPSMGAVYREEIGDDRLRAATDFVHDWLFGKEGALMKKGSDTR